MKPEDEVAKKLGSRIRELREARGLSQERLAEKAQLHRTYLGGIERGLRNPALRNIAKIAEALETSVATLFEEEQL